MPIAGLSDVRMVNRLGKVHTGIKEGDHPMAVDYFVFQPAIPEIGKMYGPKPNNLRIQFVYSKWQDNVPQFRRLYFGNRLLCRGDGVTANWFGKADSAPKDGKPEEIREGESISYRVKCSGEECLYSNECKINGKAYKRLCYPTMNLLFRIPEVEMVTGSVGLWQLDTRSYNSIVRINSMLDINAGILERQGFDITYGVFKLSVAFEKSKQANKAYRFPVLSLIFDRLYEQKKQLAASEMGNHALADESEAFVPQEKQATASEDLLWKVFNKAKARLSALGISVTDKEIPARVLNLAQNVNLEVSRFREMTVEQANVLLMFIDHVAKEKFEKMEENK